MLNPIDTAAVFRDGHVAGTYPDQLHKGVAWWIGACYVVSTEAHGLVLGHDGHSNSAEFADRFSRGAINARHYKCTVAAVGRAEEQQVLQAASMLGNQPAAWITTTGSTVTIRLYGTDGQLATPEHLARIQIMINKDRVPIPVNDEARGVVADRRDLLNTWEPSG